MLDGPLWVRFRSFHFGLGRFHDTREMAKLKGQLIYKFVALPKNAIFFQSVTD